MKRALSRVISRLRASLAKCGLHVLFLIDSMEEYDVRGNENIKRCINGLIHFVAQDGNMKPFSYKVALPSEVFQLLRSTLNFEKYSIKTARLSWKPIELIRIAANRLLVCHYLMEDKYFESAVQKFGDRIGSDRKFVMEYFRTVFENGVQNEVFKQENVVYYALRHSQLLPRQVINLLSEVLKASKPITGTYHIVEQGTFDSAILRACDTIVNGIVHGHQHVYPRLAEVFEQIIPRCPVACAYGYLHNIFNNSGVRALSEEYTDHFGYFLTAMIDIGVFGIFRAETENYLEGDFQYCSDVAISYSEKDRLLLHPAFSRRYLNADARRAAGKAVLPRGTFQGVL